MRLFLLNLLPPPPRVIEYHVLPVVRQVVARLAAAARYTLVACALLALAEPLFLLLMWPLAGIACGMVSALLLQLAVALLVLLAMWCHAVLLAGQGISMTRWLLRVCAVLVPVAPVGWVYTLLTGKLLLYRQAELPLILCVVLLMAGLLNIPRMAAARWLLQLRVVLLPLLLLLALCCDVPGLVLPCIVFKLLATWAALAPLKQLQTVSPRIISMPELG